LKKTHASSIVMARTSAMLLSLKRISRVSSLNRRLLQSSHVTSTSGRNCISTVLTPAPLHVSHRPPLTLKLKRPFL